MKRFEFLCILVLLLLQLSVSDGISLKSSSNNIEAFKKDKDKDYFSPVKGAPGSPKPEAHVVANYEELTENFGHILNDRQTNAFFILKESKTFLSRKVTNSSKDEPENLDNIGGKALSLPKFKNPFRKGDNSDDEEEETVEWVEFSYDNAEEKEYPGYVPVSGCQSQEYGTGGGSIGFTYSFIDTLTGTNSFETEFGVSYAIFSLSISMTLSISLSTTKTIDGATSCTIPTGYIGQVLMKPRFLSTTPSKRRVQWEERSKSLLLDNKFERFANIYVLLNEETLQIDCATSDVVDLFCDGVELGKVDWENPKGVGYEEKIYHKKPQ